MVTWEQSIKNYDKKLDHDEIDEFLDHLNTSVNQRIKKLADEFKSLSPDQFEHPNDIDGYREHLIELMASSSDSKALGDELSIVALYKKVERHSGRVIKKQIPSAASKNLSYFNQLSDSLPFGIDTIEGFSNFNELRLVNNAIKHGGTVSEELSIKFPNWIENDEISSLDKVFQRLLPGVKLYVADLVEKLYAYNCNS